MSRTAIAATMIVILLLGCAVWTGLKPERSPVERWRSVNGEVAAALAETKADIGIAESRHDPGPPQQKNPQQLDLNSASAEELDSLPGIGPVKAKAIVDYRTSIGRFQSLEQLMEVKGIGPKIFAGLLPTVIIGAAP